MARQKWVPLETRFVRAIVFPVNVLVAMETQAPVKLVELWMMYGTPAWPLKRTANFCGEIANGCKTGSAGKNVYRVNE